MFEEEVGAVTVLNGVEVCEAVSRYDDGCRKQDQLDLQRKSAIDRVALGMRSSWWVGGALISYIVELENVRWDCSDVVEVHPDPEYDSQSPAPHKMR